MAISIVDHQRAIHSQPDASFVHTLIPSLSDDPETIEELQYAIRRFLAPTDDPDPLAHWRADVDDKPFDTGICIVDLAARFIVFQSTECDFLRQGSITFEDPDDPKAKWIPYHVPNDWLVSDSLDGWKSQAAECRATRSQRPMFDSRAVLYGRLAEFIAGECQAAHGGSTDANGVWTPPSSWQWRELPRRGTKKRRLITDAIAEIHARWLMATRDDLAGQSPRQLLHAHRAEIGQQLQDREMQWSYFCSPPQPIGRESTAYRFAGYGIHEVIIYYDLVRHLLVQCWDMVNGERKIKPAQSRAAIIDRLGMIQQEWLHTPQSDYGNKSPAQIIERERLRLPMGVSGQEAVIDCDCPICQMMAESDQPSFWHLDGCHMDSEFPFDVYEPSFDAWKVTHGDCDESDDDDDLVAYDAAEKFVLPDRSLQDTVSDLTWQRSFAGPQLDESPGLQLFGLGCHLAELIDSIRKGSTEAIQIVAPAGRSPGRGSTRTKPPASPPIDDTQHWIDSLNRSFSNLRHAVADPGSALIKPIAARFTEDLLALAEVRPSLRAKCLDLDRQLFDFVQQLNR
jgi:hypothetical protein